MSKQNLVFSDFKLSTVPEAVRTNDYWQRCIELALQGRSENQRYGALVVLDQKIIGEGRNRLLGRTEVFPFRTSFFLHAETSAIGAAILNVGEKNVAGATVYVSGFFVQEKKFLIIRKKVTNTCLSCSRLYQKFGLQAAFMTKDGWVDYSGEVALKNALENQELRRRLGLTKKQLRLKLF